VHIKFVRQRQRSNILTWRGESYRRTSIFFVPCHRPCSNARCSFVFASFGGNRVGLWTVVFREDAVAVRVEDDEGGYGVESGQFPPFFRFRGETDVSEGEPRMHWEKRSWKRSSFGRSCYRSSSVLIRLLRYLPTPSPQRFWRDNFGWLF